jgi:hypothetical protein
MVPTPFLLWRRVRVRAVAGRLTDNREGDAMKMPRVWAGAMLGAVLAAVGTWLVGESGTLDVPPAKGQYRTMSGMVTGVTPETRQVAANKTAARVYGVYGAALGLALGVAGGLAAGQRGGAGTGAGVGAIAGAAVGAVAPLAVVPSYNRLAGEWAGSLGPALVMHSGLWAPIGATAGLALGLGLGGRARAARAALGGALGAVVGAGVYELLGAVAFPLAETTSARAATALPRLLALLLTALPAAACAVVAAGAAKETRAADRDRPATTEASTP